MRGATHRTKWSSAGARILLVTALAGTVAAPAAAQDVAAAEALFRRGVEDLKAGRFEQACVAIAESQRLDPQAGTLFTLAQCEEKRGHTATALARYHDYLALVAGMTADQRTAHGKRAAIARAHVAQIEPQIPELTLSLPPKAPPGTVVKRDGVVVSAATLGMPLPIDPGDHVVIAEAPGGPPTELRIAIRSGEKKTVVVEVKPAPPAPPPRPAAPATGTSGQRIAAWVTGGIGLAALAVGGAMGGLTLAKKATIDAQCGVGGVKTDCRSQEGADAGNSAQKTALASTIGFGVGGAALVTALILRLTEPKKATTPEKKSATVRPGVLAAGDAGAVIGLRGTW
ncbi:MAG: hypothetical protein QM820_09200 [Minicystis sp.]